MTYRQCLTFFTFALSKYTHAKKRGKGPNLLHQTRRCLYTSQESLFKNSTLDVCRCCLHKGKRPQTKLPGSEAFPSSLANKTVQRVEIRTYLVLIDTLFTEPLAEDFVLKSSGVPDSALLNVSNSSGILHYFNHS